MKDESKRYAVTVAAACAASTSVLCGYPFDSMKTRMQAFKYPSMASCIRHTYSTEGLIGFYRGCLPVLLSTSILRATTFSIYTSSKEKAMAEMEGWNRITQIGLSAWIGGMLTGTIITFFSAPIELIKVQKQLERLGSLVEYDLNKVPSVHSEASHSIGSVHQHLSSGATAKATSGKSTWEWAKYIFRSRGFSGMYTGFPSHLTRDLLGTAVYFSIYETFKEIATPSGQKAGPLIHMLGGGLAGTFSWLIIFPIDMVKSVLQKDAFSSRRRYRGAFHFIQTKFRKRGFFGFYSGIGPQLVRSFPVHAINFLVYERVLLICTNM